jgi:peptide/nickel transport system substrate-binding protein
MTRFQRTVITVLAPGLVAALLLASTALAQSASSSGTGDEKVTLTVGVDTDITSLNPFQLCCGPDYEYLSLVYDLAFQFDRDTLEAAPGLVQEWTPNEDSSEWTLTIVEGATWHDGQPVTADDVAFTFSFIAENKMPFFKDYLPLSPTFEVLDATHVLWKASAPTFAPTVPAYIPILPQHIWEQFVVPGDAKATRTAAREFPNEEAIGSGAFKLAEYAEGEFLKLEVNTDYWGGQPKAIDEVVFQVFQSQEAMTQAIRSGEIDYAWGLKPGLFNSLKGQEGIGTRIGDGGCWGNIAWNFGGQDGGKDTADPIVHDIEFRQAMSLAIDRREIVTKVYQDTALVGYSILMTGSNGSWVTEIPEELRFDYDPEAAKTKLEAAGITDTDGDGLRNGPDGKNIELELLVINDVTGSVDTGKLTKGYFKDVGIDSFLTTVDQNKAGELWFTGEWDAYVWDWCPDPDPDFMLSVFTTDQCMGWSDGCYSNPDYDELYNLQQTQLDRAERKATVDQMQLIVAEEVPTMVLNYWSDLSAYRTDRFDPSTWMASPNNDVGLYLFGWTNDSYFNLQLIGGGGAAPAAAARGVPGWIWVAVLGGIVLIAAVVMIARKKSPDESEA